MNQLFKRSISLYLVFLVYIGFTLWWLGLHLFVSEDTAGYSMFSDTYGVLACVGGLIGLAIAKQWGSFRSFMGKSIIFLSLGLLFQFFGQVVYSIYFFAFHVEVPYPSWGDLFFFGSIPLYILGAWYLAKASGCGLTISKLSNKIIAIVLPAMLLIISYFIFLQGLEIEQGNPIKLFLDFGYPLGQSLYLSMALLTYLLSRDILGGVMKKRIIIVLFAFFIQYVADFVFLYKQSRGIWTPGGVSELIYLNAYFVMSLGLLSLSTVADALSHKVETEH